MHNRNGNKAPACARRYSEIEWVDCLLGRFDPLQTRDMTAHLIVCPACRAVHDEWESLLGKEETKGTAFGQTDNVPKSLDTAGIPRSPYPSEGVRLSLRQAVKRRGTLRRFGRPALRASFGAAAAVVVLLLLSVLMEPKVTPASGGEYVERHEPRATALLHAPETAAFRVEAAAASIGGGYVWLNGAREEAVLLLDDLPAYNKFDYRAWALAGGEYIDMGLMQIYDGRAHLYVKGPFLRAPENIAVSAEPKGGGLRPPSRDTVIVILQR